MIIFTRYSSAIIVEEAIYDRPIRLELLTLLIDKAAIYRIIIEAI